MFLSKKKLKYLKINIIINNNFYNNKIIFNNNVKFTNFCFTLIKIN